MKKITSLFALVFSLFCFGLVAEAAEPTKPKATPPLESTSLPPESSSLDLRRHGISLELLGRGGLYSFNYDYMITDDLALGAGLATYSISSNGSNASAWVVPVYANYYITGQNHRLFVTGGADVVFSSGKLAGDTQVSGSGLAGVLGAGYEYRGDSGFLFRAAPYLMVGKISGTWLGLSFGYAI